VGCVFCENYCIDDVMKTVGKKFGSLYEVKEIYAGVHTVHF
jgi:hypothetical protein